MITIDSYLVDFKFVYLRIFLGFIFLMSFSCKENVKESTDVLNNPINKEGVFTNELLAKEIENFVNDYPHREHNFYVVTFSSHLSKKKVSIIRGEYLEQFYIKEKNVEDTLDYQAYFNWYKGFIVENNTPLIFLDSDSLSKKFIHDKFLRKEIPEKYNLSQGKKINREVYLPLKEFEIRADNSLDLVRSDSTKIRY